MQSSLLALIRGFCYSAARGFENDLGAPEKAQSRVLARLVGDLASAGYGARLGIDGSESYAEFSRKVPIQNFEQLVPWIDSLSPHRTVHVEPTSGSSGTPKRIPYTVPLLKDFTNMFAVWAYDVLSHGPKFRTGNIFISTSSSSNRLGFATDDEYLREPLRTLVKPFLRTSLWDAEDVEIISIWSPSYLHTILDQVEGDWKSLWPNLKLVSCWDQGSAASQALTLRSRLGGVQVQGKGLLCTEAPITVPWSAAHGCVPLVGNVFMEFVAEGGTVKLVHELIRGEEYELVISQSGGLTRYRTHDVVRVVGFYKDSPILEFMGRNNQTSDLVGEKLTEKFVRQALKDFAPFVLVPAGDRYEILVDREVPVQGVEWSLRMSHHYRLARELQQLQPVQIRVVSDVGATMRTFLQSEGMKLGDIKETCLVTDLTRAQRLLAQLRRQTVEQSIQPGSIFQSPFRAPVETSTF